MARRARTLRRLLGRVVAWLRWKLLPGYPAPGLLINEAEFRPQVRRALRYLQEKLPAAQIGDYLEFGVCNGTSLRIVYDELLHAKLDGVRLFGFDSFAGLPHDDERVWEEGSFAVDYDTVVRSLDGYGVDWQRVTLVKGFYSDTLTDARVAEHGLHSASLIMIDCDLYSSTKQALAFCRPLLTDEAVIFFDDWNPTARQNKGEKRAFDEFMQAHPEFEAVEMGEYSFKPGDRHSAVFRVSRTRR